MSAVRLFWRVRELALALLDLWYMSRPPVSVSRVRASGPGAQPLLPEFRPVPARKREWVKDGLVLWEVRCERKSGLNDGLAAARVFEELMGSTREVEEAA